MEFVIKWGAHPPPPGLQIMVWHVRYIYLFVYTNTTAAAIAAAAAAAVEQINTYNHFLLLYVRHVYLERLLSVPFESNHISTANCAVLKNG